MLGSISDVIMKKIFNENLMGQWSIPNLDINSVNGNLYYDNLEDQYKLKIIQPVELGSEEISLFDNQELDRIPIIHGQVDNGKYITLINSITIKRSFNVTDRVVLVIKPYFIIYGEEYDSIENINLKNLSVLYPNINLWIGMLDAKIIQNNENNLKTYNININPQENEIWNIDDFLITKKVVANFSRSVNENIRIYQKNQFIFSSEAPIRLYDFLTISNKFSYLLTLFCGFEIKPDELFYESNNNISNIYQNSKFAKINKIKDISPIIPYSLLEENFEKHIKIWYEKQEKLQPIINRFIDSHRYESDLIKSFLAIVQALEVYYRRVKNNELRPQNEHNEQVNRILSDIKVDEDKVWLDQLFSYPGINELSFRKKITKALKETAFAFKISKSKFNKLSNRIVDTRNYYTHFDERLKNKVFNDQEIFYVKDIIKNILRVLLLQELEVEEAIIVESISKEQKVIQTLSFFELIQTQNIMSVKFRKNEE